MSCNKFASLRDQLLPVLDQARQIAGNLGIYRYSVTLRTRTWSGTYPGEGVSGNVDVVLAPRPRVKVLRTDEVASSGGTYREGDFKIDQITPAYTVPTSGGYAPSALNIRPTLTDQDTTIILTGDEGTIECQVVEFHFDDPFNYWMVVRERRTAVGTTLG